MFRFAPCYEVIMYWAGSRLASFIGLNLLGPEVHSIYKLITVDENFIKITSMYENANKYPEAQKIIQKKKSQDEA